MKRAPSNFQPSSLRNFPSSQQNQHSNGEIVNVWAHNFHQEMQKIMELVDDYPYIAMDTEFPGVVARPVGSFKNTHDYHYQTLKCNVDILKIIQLGLTFCAAPSQQSGQCPPCITWQFNFKFSLQEDMYAQDSIELLMKSGMDFKKNEEEGIDVAEFAELIMCSGIVLNEDIRFLSFHSGYDFGYLLKLLTNQPLPKDESEFFALLHLYFPCFYDIKYLMKSCENLNGGLQKVAEKLNVERIGPQHQAGSDALLTAATFFKMRDNFFEGNIDDDKYMGVLFGLGQDLPQRSAQNGNVPPSLQGFAAVSSSIINPSSALLPPSQSYSDPSSAQKRRPTNNSRGMSSPFGPSYSQ